MEGLGSRPARRRRLATPDPVARAVLQPPRGSTPPDMHRARCRRHRPGGRPRLPGSDRLVLLCLAPRCLGCPPCPAPQRARGRLLTSPCCLPAGGGTAGERRRRRRQPGAAAARRPSPSSPGTAGPRLLLLPATAGGGADGKLPVGDAPAAAAGLPHRRRGDGGALRADAVCWCCCRRRRCRRRYYSLLLPQQTHRRCQTLWLACKRAPAPDWHPPARPRVGQVREALSLAYDAHAGQKRKSGEPFITHPVEVGGWVLRTWTPAQHTPAAVAWGARPHLRLQGSPGAAHVVGVPNRCGGVQPMWRCWPALRCAALSHAALRCAGHPHPGRAAHGL